MEDEKLEPETTIEELIKVSLDENHLNQKVLVGALLNEEERQELTDFLGKIRIYLPGITRTCHE